MVTIPLAKQSPLAKKINSLGITLGVLCQDYNIFLGALLSQCTQSAPRKPVDLDHSCSLFTLDWACWYLNESSLHEEYEYVIIILFRGIGLWHFLL